MEGFDNQEAERDGTGGPPPIISMVLALVASIGLMMYDRSGDHLAPLRNVLATASYPLDSIASVPGDMARSFDDYLSRSQLIEENESLEEQILLLRGRLQKLAALQAENARIRNLLQSSSQLQDEVIIAEVLAASPDPYRQLLKLNKGSNAGVAVGQAVVDSNGIMGQILMAHPLHSLAILITDANHGIPVELNRTGLQTIAQGVGRTDVLSLPFLTVNTNVREGDLLVTSGLGERYPVGYPVARVTRIVREPGEEFLSITARPTAGLNRGREALIVVGSREITATNAFPARADKEASADTPGDSVTIDDPERGEAE